MSETATTEAVRPAEDSSNREALLSYADFRIEPHHCFACGELNEHGLHLKLQLTSGRCTVELTLPNRFEGWEGLIHGGIVCTILDEVMAWALVERDTWGVTARMSVAFRGPVLVGQAIRAEGWIVESKRRIQRTAGRIVDTETGLELATAEATYVAATEARKRELKERYAPGAGGVAMNVARRQPEDHNTSRAAIAAVAVQFAAAGTAPGPGQGLREE